MTEKSEKLKKQFTVGSWKKRDIESVFNVLEKPNWAPWLAASSHSLAGRVDVFPNGQLVVKSLDNEMLASLSINRINWDGSIDTLPTWDEVAGDPTTFEHTFVPDGNTLTMMSMNVNPNYQGSGYARKLIEQAKYLAVDLGVDYLIGSFRPNQYGKHKLTTENPSGFEDYCKMIREDGLSVDSWIRNLKRNGMKPLAVDHNAMVVPVSISEFEGYKREYNPENWKEIEDGVWECAEVGSWFVDDQKGVAVYRESNLWGLVWTKTGLQ